MQRQKSSTNETASKDEETGSLVNDGSSNFSHKGSSTSWKGIASRYKRLLHSKPQEDEFRKGILTFAGFIFFPFILISPLSMIGGVLYTTLGAFIGNFITNSKYDLDLLTNIHLGVLGSLPIIGYFTYVLTLSVNSLVALFPVLMCLVISIILGIIFYGELGRTLN
jgi:hypothetical protein